MEYSTRSTEIFAQLCGFKKKWGLFIHFDGSMWDKDPFPMEEIIESANWLKNFKDRDQFNLILNPELFIFSDSLEEIYDLYYRTIGDDGAVMPELNNYSGDLRHYCLIVNPQGELVTENT